MEVDDKIAEPIKLVLTERGNVFDDGIEGSWEMKDGNAVVY